MAVEGLSIRLYLDHNLDHQFARDLRRRGFEAITASEVGNARASDEDHLRWATAHRMTLLTHDADDFPRIADEWFLRGSYHAGILLAVAAPKTTYRQLLRRLLGFLNALSADEMINRWNGWTTLGVRPFPGSLAPHHSSHSGNSRNASTWRGRTARK